MIGSILAVVLLAQSIMMSMMIFQASVSVINQKRDFYGSVLCTTSDNKSPSHQSKVPSCCTSGCVLSSAIVRLFSPVLFLTLHLREGEILKIIRVIEQPNLYERFNHKARAPPIVMT
ncbi:hypothetical protein [Bartonella tamiae]|uniref:Uncharacterized protein n=1 Tax=Bartonella tamiae Th239 TaxID=1094558 RepID=J1K206_9HYPH|nr:hypothetical protein [Bartonella tamiae]EJF91120.1 hypothetical protein ME5_00452 [Bartonella tamiae Th239]EJF93215.1 hypothetical protein MEG_01429 [Bartonella tamiae Th307]